MENARQCTLLRCVYMYSKIVFTCENLLLMTCCPVQFLCNLRAARNFTLMMFAWENVVHFFLVYMCYSAPFLRCKLSILQMYICLVLCTCVLCMVFSHLYTVRVASKCVIFRCLSWDFGVTQCEPLINGVSNRS